MRIVDFSFFFLRNGRDYIKTSDLTEKPRRNVKLQSSPSSRSRRGRRRGAVGGAPLPLLRFTPWMGVSPEAAGKSPIARSADPTRRSAATIAMESTISSTLILRIRRIGSGRGAPSTAAPENDDLDEDDHRTQELRGPPAREGEAAVTTLFTAAIPTSRTTPAAVPPNPTLSTGLDLRIPHPPVAEATAGGGGIRRSEASKVGRRWGVKKSPLYCAGERRDVQGSSQSWAEPAPGDPGQLPGLVRQHSVGN